MGRQRYKPKGERRELVLKLAGLGVPQDQIAMLVKCSPKTLRKHFHGELARGSAEANAQVAGFLFQSAKNGNVAAQIFWLKSRGRWKESPHDAPDVFDPVAEQAKTAAPEAVQPHPSRRPILVRAKAPLRLGSPW